jgi:hypothetical protein
MKPHFGGVDIGHSIPLICKKSSVIDMSRWKWVLLIFELTLFLVILILPQVELPDFTFHGGTSPVATKIRVSGPPARPVVSRAARKQVFPEVTETSLDQIVLVSAAHAEKPLLLSCALLC